MIFVKYHKLFLWLACILSKFSYNMAVLCICIPYIQTYVCCMCLSFLLPFSHAYIHLTYLMCIMGSGRKYHNVKNWNEKTLRSNDDIFAPDQNSKQIDSSSDTNVPWCTLHRVFETMFCMHAAYSPFLVKFKYIRHEYCMFCIYVFSGTFKINFC